MNNLSILYVEDDPMVRENFVEILGHYFSHIFSAEDGLSAYDLYLQHRPDILLLDISLPKMSGLDLAEKIREDDDKVAIVMMTAYADQEKLMRAVNLQLHAYLVKPVQVSELDKSLTSLIDTLQKEEDILWLKEDFKWDQTQEELLYHDEVVQLTQKERLIMRLLTAHPTQFFSACEITNELYERPKNDDTECNNVVQIISRFKSKIINTYDKDLFFIQNTYGLGYKIRLR